MVAIPCSYCTPIDRSYYCGWRRICCCTIYLYIILIKGMKDITRKETLEACLAISTGFMILFAIFNFNLFLIISIVVGLIGMFIPIVAKFVTWIWLKFAHGLGFINSKVLLTVVFYLFLVPIALLSRLFTKNESLQLKKKNGKFDSYFVERNHKYLPEDFKDLW